MICHNCSAIVPGSSLEGHECDESLSSIARRNWEEEYSDSQRMDEMMTAEDYNRWEEDQVFMDGPDF